MIYPWLYAQAGAVGIIAATLFFGLLFYFVLVQISYHYVFVRHRTRYVPDYRPVPTELWQARKWSVINVVGNTLLVFPIQLLIALGWSQLYVGTVEHGWTYLTLSSIGAIIFAETAIYWLHRLLHARPFYDWFHAVHHRFREPTSLTAYAFNPIDSFTQSLPYHLYVFIVPTDARLYFALWLFSSMWTMMIHDRVRVLPDSVSGIVNHTGCHTAHHWFYRYNYGNYFTFWDRICGTYFDPNRLPDKFFAVKSRADVAALKTPAAEAFLD